MTSEYDFPALRKCSVLDVQNSGDYDCIFPMEWLHVKLVYKDEDVANHLGLLQIDGPCPFCKEATRQSTVHTWVDNEEAERSTYNLLSCSECRNYIVIKGKDYYVDPGYVSIFTECMWFSASSISQSVVREIVSNLSSGQGKPLLGSKIFNDEKQYKIKSIYFLRKYHPYHGGLNPNFRATNSGLVLDLKEGKESAVDHFLGVINKKFSFGESFTVCVVPSSNPEKIDSGIKRLAKRLAADHNRIDGTSCLVRTEKIHKLAHGGLRDKQIHLDTIKVVKHELIEGQEVLLLDDVMTTKNSLIACRDLLYMVGARKVQPIAIAKTVE